MKLPKSKEALAKIIDHTLLKPEATKKQVELLCEEAIMHGFGAVCVRHHDMKYMGSILKDTDVNICTVIGFPWGIQDVEAKMHEAQMAIRYGAKELDIVMNRSYLKENNYLDSMMELVNIIDTAKAYSDKKAVVKVILETSNLTNSEIIQACLASQEAEADYVKTSTGLYGGATLKAVKLMKKTVPNMGIKASGGIKTWNKTYKMINAGATRIGTSSGIKILKEYLKNKN